MRHLIRRKEHAVDPFTELREDINQLFGFPLARWGWPGTSMLDRAFNPVLDVYEDENNVYAKAELPGLKKEDLEVSVEDGILTIKGEKKTTEEEKKKNYYRLERSFGTFQRSVSLPHTVDIEKAKANFKDGILELTLPKTEKSKTAKIKVE